MDVRDLVTGHYGGPDLVERILAAVRENGVDVESLGWADLAPIDELHAGFLPATHHLLSLLELGPAARLLDVGCGIGGPARAAAATYDCAVTGVDLTPEFVEAAKDLTRRVGLGGRVDFRRSSGESMPFADGAFTSAMLIHVGMNIPDKEAVFAQVRRVLAPGGLFGIFEQMRVGDGPLPYPMPWADDETSSFVATPEEYRAALVGAGFTIEHTEDRSDQLQGPPLGANGPLVGPQAIFGPSFRQRIGNNLTAADDGLLASVGILARAS